MLKVLSQHYLRSHTKRCKDWLVSHPIVANYLIQLLFSHQTLQDWFVSHPIIANYLIQLLFSHQTLQDWLVSHPIVANYLIKSLQIIKGVLTTLLYLALVTLMTRRHSLLYWMKGYISKKPKNPDHPKELVNLKILSTTTSVFKTRHHYLTSIL